MQTRHRDENEKNYLKPHPRSILVPQSYPIRRHLNMEPPCFIPVGYNIKYKKE